MSSEIIEGQLQPPKPTGDAAVLAAFREVTDWTDEDVLHYAECQVCDPCGDLEYYCPDSPRKKRQRQQEATAGGPYCGVCGAPAEHEPLESADGPGFTTMPGVLRCPNRCDPRQA